MKKLMAIVAALLVVASATQASVLMITLAKPAGRDTQLILNGQEVTREHLVKQMTRLAKITTDIAPIVRVMKDVPSSDLFNLLADLRTLGLHSFVIMAEGSSGAASGTHVFTINMTSNQVGFCVGPVETRDFIPDSGPELDAIGEITPEEAEPAPGRVPSKAAADGDL